jgi:uncharacterized protein YwgA
MAHIARRDVVLLLVGVGSQPSPEERIGGITRLQKLLFLLQQEAGLEPTGDGFDFAAYKAGPYSEKLYDDLEFLENLGLIDSEVAAEATEAEAAEIDLLSFEELMGEGSDDSQEGERGGAGAADAYEEKRYFLTEQGRKRMKNILENKEYRPVADGIRKIKSKYATYSLSDLLYHVYKKYPQWTTESEIKDKVLRRGRRR